MRVALTPVNVVKLAKAGAIVNIEKDAGLGSGFSNADYTTAGANIVASDDVRAILYTNNSILCVYIQTI
jgi:alanine dehydrogenase